MTGTIEINRLTLLARHGVGEQERKVGNTFEVSASLTCDMTDACNDDNLNGTVNYAEAIDIIRQQMAIPSRLLEHVAARIAKALSHAFPAIESGQITVTKTTPPCGVEVKGVSVTIKW